MVVIPLHRVVELTLDVDQQRVVPRARSWARVIKNRLG